MQRISSSSSSSAPDERWLFEVMHDGGRGGRGVSEREEGKDEGREGELKVMAHWTERCDGIGLIGLFSADAHTINPNPRIGSGSSGCRMRHTSLSHDRSRWQPHVDVDAAAPLIESFESLLWCAFWVLCSDIDALFRLCSSLEVSLSQDPLILH